MCLIVLDRKKWADCSNNGVATRKNKLQGKFEIEASSSVVAWNEHDLWFHCIAVLTLQAEDDAISVPVEILGDAYLETVEFFYILIEPLDEHVPFKVGPLIYQHI